MSDASMKQALGDARARLKQADDALYPRETDASPHVEIALVQAYATIAVAEALVEISDKLATIGEGV